MDSRDFANAPPFDPSEGDYSRQAQQASGAQPTAGMPPYPLYGIPSNLGAAEPAVPFYKRAWFGWIGGTLVGAGVMYGWFGWLKPKVLKSNQTEEKKDDK